MSMNICLEAIRAVQVIRTGEITTQRIQFDCWQTPTKITHDILAAANPLEVYSAWVIANSMDDHWPIYGDDDFFHTGPIISYEIVNAGLEHIEQIKEWVDSVEKQGYTINWYMI